MNRVAARSFPYFKLKGEKKFSLLSRENSDRKGASDGLGGRCTRDLFAQDQCRAASWRTRRRKSFWGTWEYALLMSFSFLGRGHKRKQFFFRKKTFF